MDYTYGINDDYLEDDDDGLMYSTKDYNSDSDNEQPFNLGAISQNRRHKKTKHKDSDDFEKEMAYELDATVKKLTSSFSATSSSGKKLSEPEYYDNIYFDSDQSDSEEEADSPKQSRRKEKRRILSNDELLYDPCMDDADQSWVDSKRRAYQLKTQGKRTKDGVYKPDPLPNSDAVLTCPACFTTLCLDCQRHEIYKNQYRAMFVFNCVTDYTETLHFAIKEEKKKFKKGKKATQNATSVEETPTQESGSNSKNEESSDEWFHPVMCSICTTKVGVQDNTELYHFFNILSSY